MQVKVRIDKQTGATKFEVVGGAGTACLSLTQGLESRFGEVLAKETLPEMHADVGQEIQLELEE